MNSSSLFLCNKRARNSTYDSKTNEILSLQNLDYSIDSWSSFNPMFHPINILSNITNSGITSKWSVNSLSKGEYLLLKLNKTSIVKLITFGKFNDSSALKEFKLYSGLNHNQMLEILHSHLLNETGYETLAVNDKWNNISILSNYIKLVPIKPWKSDFSMSIWFINLKGITDEKVIHASMKDLMNIKVLQKQTLWLNLTRELLLDQFRESKYYNDIISKFENEDVTKLYNSITNGDYFEIERIVDLFQKNNLLIIKNTKWSVKYKRIDFLHQEILSAFEGIENEIKINIVRKDNKKETNDNDIDNNEFNNNYNPLLLHANNLELISNHNHNLDSENEFELINHNYNHNLDSENDNINTSILSSLIIPDYSHLESLFNIDLFIPTFNANMYNYFPNENNLSIEEDVEQLFCFDNIDLPQIKSMQPWINPNSNHSNINDDIDINEMSYPCPRGGHCMVIDDDHSLLYLFGGWNGKKDLSDFWVYDIIKAHWKLLSNNTYLQNGPSARTCHKGVFDKRFNRIYLYGLNTKKLSEDNTLYIYNVVSGIWSRKNINLEMTNSIIKKTNNFNGIYDHQIAFDSQRQILYLFGGISHTNTHSPYLGLWKLDLRNDYWVSLLNQESMDLYNLCLRSRSGHSMMFDEENNELIIFGGGIMKRKPPLPLYDIIIYEISTGKLREIYHDFSKVANAPKVFYSNGSYYNPQQKAIYIYGGIEKGYNETIPNGFWVFDMISQQFHQCSNHNEDERKEEGVDYDKIACASNENNYNLKTFDYNYPMNYDTLNIPIGRFAHSFIYSQKLNCGFIFGGNPNDKVNEGYRLNDFWQFELKHYSQENIGKEIKAKIYLNYYLELLELNNHEQAIKILKDKLSLYTDESTLKKYSELLIDYDSSNTFENNNHHLSIHQKREDIAVYDFNSDKTPNKIKEKRLKLYEKIITYIKDI